MNKLLSLMTVFVIGLLSLSMVSALQENVDVNWGTIKVNGDVIDLNPGASVLAVEEGQKLNVRIGLQANVDLTNIEVDAKISGYTESSSYANLEDSTTLFDVKQGTTKYVELTVDLPAKLEKSEYLLRVRISDKNTDAVTKDIKLQVEPKRHGVDISDVVLSPGSSIKAGRSLLATVLLENFGTKNEKNVKVTVAIPELSVSASEFVDSLNTDNGNVAYEDVPEMFLPIPATAAAGNYNVKVTAEFDGETVTKTYPITVLTNEAFQTSNKLVLAVGPETQPVVVGKTATYGVALTNAGSSSKAYMLSAVAGDWATVSMSDSLVVLEAGKNKVVYVEVTPTADASAGEHVLSLSVKSGNDVLETVALKATVMPAQKAAEDNTFNLRNGLEIALIILVVLLVIIGLIIGFSRLRKDDDEKTYY